MSCIVLVSWFAARHIYYLFKEIIAMQWYIRDLFGNEMFVNQVFRQQKNICKNFLIIIFLEFVINNIWKWKKNIIVVYSRRFC